MAERALEMMVHRVQLRTAFKKTIAEHGSIQQVFLTFLANWKLFCHLPLACAFFALVELRCSRILHSLGLRLTSAGCSLSKLPNSSIVLETSLPDNRSR